jgi:RNA polymerase sigma-70 factor (ECF subfamily)
MSESITDQVLVARAQQGDQQAFNWLVIRYQHKLATLLSRYVASSEVADIAQETFIKAYRALPNFRADSSFYTWLYRIAINTAKNHWAAQGRRPATDALQDVTDQEASFDKLQDIANPEQLMLSEELGKVISQAIDSLSEELKLAITLREIDGLSYDEIAVIMGCPVGTVRSRIFRAREAIDKKIRPLL